MPPDRAATALAVAWARSGRQCRAVVGIRSFANVSAWTGGNTGVHSSLDDPTDLAFGHFRSNQVQIRPARPGFDQNETREWVESLASVVQHEGVLRARYLLLDLLDEAQRLSVPVPQPVQTPFVNTIPTSSEAPYPGNLVLERRISNIIRWNAAVLVSDTNKRVPGVGGHIGTFASICDVLEVGLNHFWRGRDFGGGWGDSLYIQGHSAPGAYSRAFLEGRISLEKMLKFRQECKPNQGLSSYPHPRLMPEFWENPTVSMGNGPLAAVHQARFFRYLHLRGLADTSRSRVFCIVGDGEMDESETISAIAVAGRERLNNMVFIVNCNYQRLDGPVRGNSKVVQEFEGVFRGAGFETIKLLWGGSFNSLVEADPNGQFIDTLEHLPDGDCQRLAALGDGAQLRRELFGGFEARVAHLSDSELMGLYMVPGGHDPLKIYNALLQAERNTQDGGRPSVILVKTIKGYGIDTFVGRNTVHQKKTLSGSDMAQLRDTLEIPLTDTQIETPGSTCFFHPGVESQEVQYLLESRQRLGGFLPTRRAPAVTVPLPDNSVYAASHGSMNKASTTKAFGALLRRLMKSGDFGTRCVPILTDESRTFGLDAFFPEFKIHAPFGQSYTPVDASSLMKYAEAPEGQMLQEGISEAGALSTWIASGTSYASQGTPTLPFFIYYSMFGFQRVGDLIWQAADARARGFLLGATAGRTTLNGEGLQHQDGHSLLLAMTCPAVRAYDPAFGFEVASIVQMGVEEMWKQQVDVIYYLCLYNEDHHMPAIPEHVSKKDICKGLYKFRDAPVGDAFRHTVRLVGSGPILATEMLEAAEYLETVGVASEIWSATSYTELQRDAIDCSRDFRLWPAKPRRQPWVEQCLGSKGPAVVTVAASDHMRALPELLRGYVSGTFVTLGTEGFGRSDSRAALRRFFEVDKAHVVLAALSGLVQNGKIDVSVMEEVQRDLGVDYEKEDIAAIAHTIADSA